MRTVSLRTFPDGSILLEVTMVAEDRAETPEPVTRQEHVLVA